MLKMEKHCNSLWKSPKSLTSPAKIRLERATQVQSKYSVWKCHMCILVLPICD